MLELSIQIYMIYASSALALIWAIYNSVVVTSIQLRPAAATSDDEASQPLTSNNIDMLQNIGDKISKGANSFLFQEYSIMSIFIVVFSVVVLLIVDVFGQKDPKFRCYATISFVIGAVTSILCGFIGMRIAVAANYRTTYKAKSSLSEAFIVAYRAGCVMGFSSVGLAL